MSLLTDGQKQVTQLVAASVPEGKRAALVFVATQDGGQFYTAARVGEHWQLEARASSTWKHPKDVVGEVRIVGSW